VKPYIKGLPSGGLFCLYSHKIWGFEKVDLNAFGKRHHRYVERFEKVCSRQKVLQKLMQFPVHLHPGHKPGFFMPVRF
jgi:hypothetical protein